MTQPLKADKAQRTQKDKEKSNKKTTRKQNKTKHHMSGGGETVQAVQSRKIILSNKEKIKIMKDIRPDATVTERFLQGADIFIYDIAKYLLRGNKTTADLQDIKNNMKDTAFRDFSSLLYKSGEQAIVQMNNRSTSDIMAKCPILASAFDKNITNEACAFVIGAIEQMYAELCDISTRHKLHKLHDAEIERFNRTYETGEDYEENKEPGKNMVVTLEDMQQAIQKDTELLNLIAVILHANKQPVLRPLPTPTTTLTKIQQKQQQQQQQHKFPSRK